LKIKDLKNEKISVFGKIFFGKLILSQNRCNIDGESVIFQRNYEYRKRFANQARFGGFKIRTNADQNFCA
jgi:hypothetical protein